jgi:hypothetical protein
VRIRWRDASRALAPQLSNPSPSTLNPTTTPMNSLVQRFDTNSAISEIKRAKAIVEEDGDNVSDLMWGSYGGFGNLATGVPKFNIPAVPDVSFSTFILKRERVD